MSTADRGLLTRGYWSRRKVLRGRRYLRSPCKAAWWWRCQSTHIGDSIAPACIIMTSHLPPLCSWKLKTRTTIHSFTTIMSRKAATTMLPACLCPMARTIHLPSSTYQLLPPP